MKNISKVFVILQFVLLQMNNSFAQDLVQSTTYIDTYYQGEKHFSIKNASYIFCSVNSSEIYIVLNFSDLKSGIDSLDQWLIDLSDSKLIFKGHLPSSDLLLLTHHNTKSISVEGEIMFNGVKHNHTVEMNFFEISKEGILYRNNGHDYFDRLAVNIQFSFLPKEFGIQKKPHHLKKKISVAIGKGVINEYKPEHEKLLK